MVLEISLAWMLKNSIVWIASLMLRRKQLLHCATMGTYGGIINDSSLTCL